MHPPTRRSEAKRTSSRTNARSRSRPASRASGKPIRAPDRNRTSGHVPNSVVPEGGVHGLRRRLVPVYVRQYGWRNFLWFSDVALFVTIAALWLENALL